MPLPPTPTLPPAFDSLRDYPRWFVVTCGLIVAVAGAWLVGGLLRWLCRLLLIGGLLVGALLLAWVILR